MPRWLLLTYLAAFAVLVGGVSVFVWWQRPPGDGAIRTRDELRRLPEGRLFYPGAVVLGESGHDYERGLRGSDPAISGYLLGTDADPKEIKAFYHRELAARGWASSSADIRVGTNEFSGGAWRRGNLSIQVSVLRPNDPRNPPAINPYSAPYRIDLVADRPTKRP